MLKEFYDEITSLESSQERNYDSDLFAGKYLNLHDRIAYLAIKKIVPEDIAMYFKSTFEIALALLQNEPYKGRYEKDMKSLTAWCYKQRIKASTPPEPHPLANKTLDIVTLTDLEQVKKHLASGWNYTTSYPATKENIPHYILTKESEQNNIDKQ